MLGAGLGVCTGVILGEGTTVAEGFGVGEGDARPISAATMVTSASTGSVFGGRQRSESQT
jgi:hypothetical protein